MSQTEGLRLHINLQIRFNNFLNLFIIADLHIINVFHYILYFLAEYTLKQ